MYETRDDVSEGQVVKWNIYSGLGRIRTTEGQEVFVRYSELTNSKWLVPGVDKVQLTVDDNPTSSSHANRLPEAKNVSRLNMSRFIGTVTQYEDYKGGEIELSDKTLHFTYLNIVLPNEEKPLAFRSVEVGDEVEITLNDGLPRTVFRTRDVLQQFAVLSGFRDKLQDLKDLAEDEEWNYRSQKQNELAATSHVSDTNTLPEHDRLPGSTEPSQSKPYFPILDNYIRYTLKRIIRDEPEKITKSSDERSAIANTGLLSRDRGEEIFAYFTLNNRPEEAPKWYLNAFVRHSDKRLSNFRERPEPPNYYSNPDELVYNTAVPLVLNVPHILDKNSDRFPAEWTPTQREDALMGAKDRALRRVRRNYKVAVPQFYRGAMQLLLPLCFDEEHTLALTVSRQGEQYYGNTVLPLDWAYNNARLVSRQDREWLDP